MGMIFHQNIGMHQAVCIFRILLQPVKIKQIVIIMEKAGLPVIPTLDDMEWNIGNNDSGSS